MGDCAGEGEVEDGVGFFQEGFAGVGESSEPGIGHADTLDALTCRSSVRGGPKVEEEDNERGKPANEEGNGQWEVYQGRTGQSLA